MTAVSRPNTRNYDILKGIVALALLIVIAILFFQGQEEVDTVEAPSAELALPALNAPQLTADGGFSLNGTGEPGSLIVLSAGSVKLGTVTVADDGTWSFSGQLDPGDYEIVASTVDADGVVLNESQAIVFTVAEPEVEIAMPEMEAPELDAEGGFSLNGTGEPGSLIVLSAGGIELGTVTVADDGTWSYSGQLGPGDYEIVASTVDADGVVLNASQAIAFTVAEPEAEIAMPEMEAPELDAEGGFSLNGTGEPGSSIVLSAGGVELGTVTVADDKTWSFSGQLEPGDYEIVATTVDADGVVLNESDAIALTVAEPEVEIALPKMKAPELDADGSLSLNGTGEPGSSIVLAAGGVELGTVTVADDGTWSFAGQLEPGDYEIVATTVDADGAVLNESEAFAFTVEETAMVAAPTLSEPDANYAGTVTLDGTGEPGATVEILVDGAVAGTSTVGGDGTWTFDYPAAAGEYKVAVQNEAQPDSLSDSTKIFVTAGLPVTGERACHVYVVEEYQWLSQLARLFYGDATLYLSIIEATNAEAAADPSFEEIIDPDFIVPGQKLCMPSP
jgi:predicted nuclease of predicted toxin-antitoxin system